MKITNECYLCLGRLVHQAAELATSNPDLRDKAVAEGMKLLDDSFSLDKTSIQVAAPLHKVIRSVTNNPDPYFEMKKGEVDMARHLRQDLCLDHGDSLMDSILLAVRGNTIDFFRDLAEIEKGMMAPVGFAVDDTAKLEEKLLSANRILYLADNTGEVLFDIDLVRRMGEYGSVTYVVKESPVQNDVALSDVEYFGFAADLPRIISTGIDTPGVDMEIASEQFRLEFESADLILAKGMGYWETLSELPAQGKVFYLLKSKCQPVADSLSVPLDSYVALLR